MINNTSELKGYDDGKTTMNELDRVYQKNQNFVFRQIDDETLLVPIKDSVGDMGAIYNLNSVAAFVWQHLDGHKTLQDIKGMLTDEFEVSDPIAEQDLTEFVAELENIDAVFPAFSEKEI
jgi:methyltransferase-like protein